MKEIIYNYDLIDDSVINREVCRAKLLIINSNDEILLGTSAGNYQIPGGHLDEGESFEEALVREIKEEVGISIPKKERIPFLVIKYYCKDYPETGINSRYIAKYYFYKTDVKPNLSNINLTEEEKYGKFHLEYIPKDKIMQVLEESLKTCTLEGVVGDTIEAVGEFLKVSCNNLNYDI